MAWYPGSDKKYQEFKGKFSDAEEFGVKVHADEYPAAYHPWVFKSDLSPDEVTI